MFFHGVHLVVLIAFLFQDSHQSFSNYGSRISHVSSYTVAIIRDNDFHQRCIGTLISDSFVLTAAQCVDCESAVLILGAYDIFAREKTQIHQFITEKYIILHPLYDPRTLDNDIALIRLPEKVKLSPFINLAALPHSNLLIPPGKKLDITGFERRLAGYSNTLSQNKLTIISNDKCSSYWPASRISEKKLCGASTHRDDHLPHLLEFECIIDPGSSLTLPGQPDKIVGILTSDARCGTMWPLIFTSVSEYIEWIISEIHTPKYEALTHEGPNPDTLIGSPETVVEVNPGEQKQIPVKSRQDY